MTSLHGIIPPLTTPADANGALDEAGLRRLIQHSLEAGVSGLFMLGTTGRFNRLTNAVQRRIMRITADEIGCAAPVSLIANISDLGLERSLDQAQRLSDLPIEYFSALPPLYEELQQNMLYEFYARLADELERPLLLYHFPHRTPLSLCPATVKKLVRHGNIAGMKDSSGDIAFANEMLELRRGAPDFIYITGSVHLLLQTLMLDGNGMVAGEAVLFPHLAMALYRAWQSGDEARASQLQTRLTHSQRIFNYGGFSAMAAACRELGLCDSIIGEDTASAPGPQQMASIRRIIEESRRP